MSVSHESQEQTNVISMISTSQVVSFQSFVLSSVCVLYYDTFRYR